MRNIDRTNFTKIGDFIKERRTARNMSQEELARLARTSQQNVNRIETGEVKHSRYIAPILAALGTDMGQALSITVASNDLVPRDLLIGDKGMPLYASTQGGDGSYIINFDPIDYLKWPAPLLQVKQGFGVLVEEQSMFPVYEPGDIALVNPKMLPRRNKNCVLLNSGEAGHHSSLIKRYQGQSETHWSVAQWNPAKEFKLEKREWPQCFAVVGKYDSR